MKKQIILSTATLFIPFGAFASCGIDHAENTAVCPMPTTMSEESASINHSSMDHSMHGHTTHEIKKEDSKETSEHLNQTPAKTIDHSKMNHSMENMEIHKTIEIENKEANDGLKIQIMLPAIDHSQMDHFPESMSHKGSVEMNHSMEFKGIKNLSSEAYFKANMDMHTNMNIEYSNDPDLDFLRGMIPHHQGAINMAKIQLKYGKDGSLKHVTSRIISDQKREITWLKAILANEEKTTPVLNKLARTETEEKNSLMHKKMNIKFSGNADIDFVKGMIPHHEGAIAMAQTVLRYGNNPAEKRMAHDIINAQRNEIYWMKQWLRRVNRR